MKTGRLLRRFVALACVPFMGACLQMCPDNPVDPEPNTGIYADEFGGPMRQATPEQLETFERGAEVAMKRFDTDTGLGPNFNVTFCGSCHERPLLGGGSPRYRDFPLIGKELSDGSFIPLGKSGVQTQFSTVAPHRVPGDPEANVVARRNAIPFFGAGAIAAIDEASILGNADPDDATLAGAISPDFCISCQAAAPNEPTVDDDDVPDPEMGEDDLFDIVAFSMLIGAPEPEPLNDQTRRGSELFEEVQCATCHVPALEGPDGLVFAYSDLLLHDMGEDLADGVVQGLASGSEFRTQPLWGIAAVQPYLHDGRADTLDEAIRWHGGEAAQSREDYEALSDDEREDLIAFLRSLGGEPQADEGLVPDDEPVPAAGEFGGPRRDLDAAEAARFHAGRDMFDRDMTVTTGLGQSFNGDSCRACHFDPIIGGAGPAGVNVTRQGIYDDETGSFFQPESGTMLHHFTITNERPAADRDCNIFKLRQTPALFGLGLIDEIPQETILANEDPDDTDQDGISGRAHHLEDGRIGRFGWKAPLPTLEDFVRDALSNEVGLTLEDDPAFLAGLSSDEDDLSDPEFGGSPYDALVFFNAMLAPPPRGPVGDDETRGEAVFAEIGCASCHVPVMETSDGTAVRLYSDLLLHDVAGEDYRGIENGEAAMNEFRTPPLWGLRVTAPYMHDGLSPTIDAAIRRHDGEAGPVATAYEGLSEADREALLKFLESI